MEADDECLKNILSDASQYVADKESTSVDTLLKLILEKRLKEITQDETDKKEIAPETIANCKKLTQELVTDIKNYAKKASHNFPTSNANRVIHVCRFSQGVCRIPKDFTRALYPSISTLKKLKSKMTPKEGTFPMIYAWFRDEFMNGSSDPVYGHIMCDEMKLRSDFYWNPKNRKCVRIVVEGDKDRISLADEVAKLYKDGKKMANKEEDSTY